MRARTSQCETEKGYGRTMETLKAVAEGIRTLNLDPSVDLNAYRRKMAEADRRQRETWSKMQSREFRRASRRSG